MSTCGRCEFPREAARLPLLTDGTFREPSSLGFARAGLDVRTIFDEGLGARSDTQIRALAQAHGRVVVTHDNDFARLAILRREPVFGIIYLRPGHRDADFTIGTLRALQTSEIDVDPPFLLVAERRGNETRVRVRSHVV